MLDDPISVDMLQQFAVQLEHVDPTIAENLRKSVVGTHSKNFYNGLVVGLGIGYEQMPSGPKKILIGQFIAVIARLLLDKE